MNAPLAMADLRSLSECENTTNKRLIDRYGRRISYLRLSVTDRCDFRCSYCMAEQMEFLPHSELMNFAEIERLVRCFVDLGVTKLRITGGEPLVRKDLCRLLESLATIPGLEHLVLTTNGSQLRRHAAALRAAGVERLNISLDSLQEERFRAITRTGRLADVLTGIYAARVAGFRRIKLNTVAMRGVNDDELGDLTEYAVGHGLDISFIEEMPLGGIGDRQQRHLATDEILARLGERFALEASDEHSGGPARYWRVAGTDTRVGLISPHSHNFCASCNRVRITARGELYPCLGHDDMVPLLPLLRDERNDAAALRTQIARGLGMKPLGHDFGAQLAAPQVMRFMSMTGG